MICSNCDYPNTEEVEVISRPMENTLSGLEGIDGEDLIWKCKHCGWWNAPEDERIIDDYN